MTRATTPRGRAAIILVTIVMAWLASPGGGHASDPATALRLGGAGADSVGDVVVLPDGSAIVVGQFEGSASFGVTTLTSLGGSDVFVARAMSDGTWAWAIRAGGTGDDFARGVALRTDGTAIVVGQFEGSASFATTPATVLVSIGTADAFVAQVTAEGSWVWATAVAGFAGRITAAQAVTSAPDGTITVAGHSISVNAFAFVARLDASGTVLRSDEAMGSGGSGGLLVTGLTLLPNGSGIVTGYFVGSVVFGTGSGSRTLATPGPFSAYVARIDPDGTWAWATAVGGSDGQQAAAVAAMPDGSAIVAGVLVRGTSTFGTTTIITLTSAAAFVAKIDSAGAWEWATSVGGDTYAFDAAVSADGSILATGTFSGVATFGTTSLTSGGAEDVFVGRLGPSGDWRWATRAGGLGSDVGLRITTADDGTVVMGGTFAGSATFDPTVLTSAGAVDGFVARLTADGRWTAWRAPTPVPAQARSALAVSCTDMPRSGESMTCSVTGGDPDVDIVWRAAYNPVFAEGVVRTGADGTGTFSFTVPVAAAGSPVTVELVAWTAPIPVGVASGPIPTSVPSGEGQLPSGSLLVAAVVGAFSLRRAARSVRTRSPEG